MDDRYNVIVTKEYEYKISSIVHNGYKGVAGTKFQVPSQYSAKATPRCSNH